MRRALLVAALACIAVPAGAKPMTLASKLLRDPKKLGANAHVTVRNDDGTVKHPPTAEDDTAASIQKLLRGPLRRGVTGLYVVDARSGDPLFSVNADDALNPASNVKMISTATVLELLGPEFRYPTRLLGPLPEAGIVHGNVYLLGSYDPTLAVGDLDDLAIALQKRGVTAIQGSVVIGTDPTRDGIFRAVVPVEIESGEPGQPPIATVPDGFDLVTVKVTATTSKRVQRPRLTFKTEATKTESGQPRITLTIGGTIGKADHYEYPLWTRERAATSAYALIAALKAHAISVDAEYRVMELGDFVGDSVATGALPIELGRHQSAAVADIIAHVNKWSINWLADRLVMTAAALVNRQPPSMEGAVDAMYGWLARHPHLDKDGLTIDTGSGLSYKTQITPHELVAIVRSAGGYVPDTDPDVARAWLHSLSVGGTDGTLQHRFMSAELRGRVLGKTGTLSNAIALSGILDVDPQRPLAFALVTNADSPLSKPFVRKAHEAVIAEICKYLAKTATPKFGAPSPPSATETPQPAPPPPTLVPVEDVDEPQPDKALDAETSGTPTAP